MKNTLKNTRMPGQGRSVASVAKRCKRDLDFRTTVVHTMRGASILKVYRGQYVHVKDLCVMTSLAPRLDGSTTLADAFGMLYRVVREPGLAQDLSEFFSVQANIESFVKAVLWSTPFADPLVRRLKIVRSHVEIAGNWKQLSVFALAGLMMGEFYRDKKTLVSTFALFSVCRPSEIDVLTFGNMLRQDMVDWTNVFQTVPNQATVALRSIIDGCECRSLALHIVNHIPTIDAVVNVCAKFDWVPCTEATSQLAHMIRRRSRTDPVITVVLECMPSVETVKIWAPDGSVEAAMIDRARSGDDRAFSWLTSTKPKAKHEAGTVDKLVDEYRRECARINTRGQLASLTRRITLDPTAFEAAVERWEATLGEDVPNCPLTCRPIVSPLVDSFGRSFERLPLLTWIARSGTHPLTREIVTPGHFTPGHQI